MQFRYIECRYSLGKGEMEYRFFASLLICCCITLPAMADLAIEECLYSYDCAQMSGNTRSAMEFCQERTGLTYVVCSPECGLFCATVEQEAWEEMYGSGGDSHDDNGPDSNGCYYYDDAEGSSCYNRSVIGTDRVFNDSVSTCVTRDNVAPPLHGGIMNNWQTEYPEYARFCYCAVGNENDGVVNVRPCYECATGYHKEINKCVQDIPCTEDCGNASWTIDSNDEKYEVKYNKICDTETGQCVSQNRAYRCAIGYYALTGLAEATTSRLKETATNQLQCTQCPEVSGTFTNQARTTAARGTTVEGGKTSVADCRIPAGTYYDESGKRVVTEYCVYDVQQ